MLNGGERRRLRLPAISPSAKLKIPAKAPMFSRKSKKRKKAFMPMATVPSQLECPRCGSKLRLLGVGAAVPDKYICVKCGYMGSVGLEPGSVKMDKRKRTV